MIPDGYRIIFEKDDSIVVGVTDFTLMGCVSPATIEDDGKIYERGMMEVIPAELSGHVCSMRTYNLINEE